MTRRSTTARGYGAAHQRRKAAWQARIDAGWNVRCACTRLECKHHEGPCPVVIQPGMKWDLGHDDHDRTRWTGPECVPCNRSAGARKAAAVTNGRAVAISRNW